MKRQNLDDFEARAGKKGRVIKDITKLIEAKPAAKPDYAARYAAQAHCAGGMHQACEFTQAPDLNGALSKVSAPFVALTDAQKEEMLSSDAALKAAVEAFISLDSERREKFCLLTGAKARKEATKARKADEIDPKLLRRARKIFFVGPERLPTEDDFAALASAEAGNMPIRPSFADKKAEIYHQVIKSKSVARLFRAIDARDLEAIADELDLMVTTHTANRAIHTYGRLAEIAIASQTAKD